MEGRRIRRMAGLLHARLPELDLESVPDPRTRQDRWTIGQILRGALVGVMAGCKSLWETEQLTDTMAPAARRALGLPRRLPDTTMRDALCHATLIDGIRGSLHRAIHAAWRRKALASVGLPLGVVALDGKVTALPCINGEFAQTHHPEQGPVYGLMRTVTCALVSARGQPCIDAIPIPAHTNEMGHFQTAFASIEKTYGKLFQMVTYDAGALSEANGKAVVDAGKDYLFSLKDENRIMLKLAMEMLAAQEIVAQTVDVLDNQTTVTRTLKLITVDPSWSYDQSKGPEESVWRHAKTFLAVESVTRRSGIVTENETRFFVSSRASDRLSTKQWLKIVRAHWAVENQNHNVLDTAFAEDNRPWIEADEYGMLAVLLLRRIARTLLALFRERTLRTDDHRSLRWKSLLTWVRDALVAAKDESFAGLRVREVDAAVR